MQPFQRRCGRLTPRAPNVYPGTSIFLADLTRVLILSLIEVLEPEIPEVGLFFDQYLADLSAPPSAAVVLDAFRKLRSNLTAEQLSYVPKRTVWKPGLSHHCPSEISRS